MALIQVNFLSKSLMRTVTMNVVLPIDKMFSNESNENFKTLYLLHGVIGNYTDWISNTNIQRLAEENNIAVVMPSGDNMFYLDNPKSHNYYGEFIGNELIEITRKMFPLSTKREDTYIGGLSMGGYGAIRNGLKYHENFGAIIALSSALITDDIEKRTDNVNFFIEGKSYAEACFGNLFEVKESDMNPKWLVKSLLEEKMNFPKIYMACGKGDFLYKENENFKNYLNELGVESFFEEGEGFHDWDFWNSYIKKAIEWLINKESNI